METDFSALFDEWSAHYDETVYGEDEQYRAVFYKYEHILDEVVARSQHDVLEFGVGTGNLTERLVREGKTVYGIEPSEKMRLIATQKLPNVSIQAGHFLQYDVPKVDTIVSTYAFHHLTDEEKDRAIATFAETLTTGGKVVFADTIFRNEDVHRHFIREAERRGYDRLANDLKTEFYTTIPTLQSSFERHHFYVTFERMNDYVWLIEAVKGVAK